MSTLDDVNLGRWFHVEYGVKEGGGITSLIVSFAES